MASGLFHAKTQFPHCWSKTHVGCSLLHAHRECVFVQGRGKRRKFDFELGRKPVTELVQGRQSAASSWHHKAYATASIADDAQLACTTTKQKALSTEADKIFVSAKQWTAAAVISDLAVASGAGRESAKLMQQAAGPTAAATQQQEAAVPDAIIPVEAAHADTKKRSANIMQPTAGAATAIVPYNVIDVAAQHQAIGDAYLANGQLRIPSAITAQQRAVASEHGHAKGAKTGQVAIGEQQRLSATDAVQSAKSAKTAAKQATQTRAKQAAQQAGRQRLAAACSEPAEVQNSLKSDDATVETGQDEHGQPGNLLCTGHQAQVAKPPFAFVTSRSIATAVVILRQYTCHLCRCLQQWPNCHKGIHSVAAVQLEAGKGSAADTTSQRKMQDMQTCCCIQS